MTDTTDHTFVADDPGVPDDVDVEVPDGADASSFTYPDGFGPSDLHSVESAVEAHLAVEDSKGFTMERPFNPQTGRFYDKATRGLPYGTVVGSAGVNVSCAYDDCDGHKTAEPTVQTPHYDCPECGAPRMGRDQFSESGRRRRRDRRTLSDELSTEADAVTREMTRLTEAGVGPTVALDFIFVVYGEQDVSDWATARSVSEESIKRNVRKAANALDGDVR